jgi:hypothetical protein
MRNELVDRITVLLGLGILVSLSGYWLWELGLQQETYPLFLLMMVISYFMAVVAQGTVQAVWILYVVAVTVYKKFMAV